MPLHPLHPLQALQAGAEELLSSPELLTTAVLVLHGAQDSISRVASSQRLVDQIGSRDKELQVLDEMRHLLLLGQEARPMGAPIPPTEMK